MRMHIADTSNEILLQPRSANQTGFSSHYILQHGFFMIQLFKKLKAILKVTRLRCLIPMNACFVPAHSRKSSRNPPLKLILIQDFWFIKHNQRNSPTKTQYMIDNWSLSSYPYHTAVMHK